VNTGIFLLVCGWHVSLLHGWDRFEVGVADDRVEGQICGPLDDLGF
jgi:hypothetical protein